MSKVLLSQDDWIYLYSELASYVEEKLVGENMHKIRGKDGLRLPKYDKQFCDIIDDVEAIMDTVFEKEES